MKNTLCWSSNDLKNPENQQLIKNVIEQGNLIIFPTETVYGIGANGLNPEAAKRIYEAKGRPSDNPLILHIANRLDLYRYVRYVNEEAEKLMDAFWPGPLTLVFEKNETVPFETTGGLNTVAIRFPKNEIAQKLIELAGFPLAAPSANISGKPSSTRFDHVYEDFNGRVEIIIDGGPSEIGLESTVIDMTSDIPTILRPGYVTRQMIEKTLNHKVNDVSDTKPTGAVKSPGMKYTHYKPIGDVVLIRGDIKAMSTYVKQQRLRHEGHSMAVICETEYASYFEGNVFVLGSKSNQNEMAHNLFKALRDMDKQSIEYIYIHYLDNNALGYALMNRLEKAAGYQIVDL